MKRILSFLFIPIVVLTTKSYSQCEFEISDTSLQNITSFLSQTKPSIVDIDNDGDMDAFIGESLGLIYYYKNTGNSTSPVFSLQIGSSNPFDGVFVGTYSVPTIVDIDNDGDRDAFIGNGLGEIHYYENTGSNTSPVFSLQSGSSNPFNGADVGGYSAPAFFDIDNDGDMDAFIGEALGAIHYYKNTGSTTSPVFSLQSGSSNPFDGVEVSFGDSKPAFVDIDNDGDMDAFIGKYYGEIYFLKNACANTSTIYSEQLKETTSLVVYPNPSNGIVNIEFQSSQNNSSTITLFDVVGKMVYQNVVIGNTTQLSVSNLQVGVYFLQVESHENYFTQKITVIP